VHVAALHEYVNAGTGGVLAVNVLLIVFVNPLVSLTVNVTV
jgi:hypothetical protein